VFARH